MSLNGGPHIVLGGNGLGKTTIMQAVVFGLTGGAGEAVEEDKTLRWDHRYFRGRLSSTLGATVEVDFALDSNELTVRRGFKGPQLTGFRAGRSKKWIEVGENGNEAEEAFERALKDLGGYQSAHDFAFIVHRLLYLPESRRLLAWDTGAQVRIFMMLNQDASREEWFNLSRDRLKKLDSKKRHTHVALGKIQTSLTSLMETEEQVQEKQEGDDSVPFLPPPDIASWVEELRRAGKESMAAEESVRTLRRALSEQSLVAEELHERIESTEAAMISALLSKQERESSLPLHKLLENAVCPACGTVDFELRAIAEKNAREHGCLLCGSAIPMESEPELATLRSQLSEKLKAQRALEDSLLIAEAKLSALRGREDELEERVNSARLREPVLSLTAPDLPDTTKDQLLERQNNLQKEEADLEAQIYKLQSSLRKEFQRFRSQVADRTAQLGDLYARYATSFLGLRCELTETEETDRLLNLTRFVPKFNGCARENPETCSEAQRFFLDIAFRMALIDLSSAFSDKPGTFLCETPETALDMSYVDNVVRMFDRFSEEGHSLLLTANIQPNGIAAKLLASVSKRNRPSHILNLLDIGQLSDVHVATLPKLRATVRKTLG
jgi:hypothetical protein